MVYRWSVPRKVTRGSERAVWMPMPSLAQNCCRVIRPLLYSRTVLESPRNQGVAEVGLAGVGRLGQKGGGLGVHLVVGGQVIGSSTWGTLLDEGLPPLVASST